MSTEDKRPSWDEYFLDIADKVRLRSKDPSTKTGAIIVDQENRPVSFGYNGFIQGADEDKLTWERPMKYFFSVHAEMNALIFAKRSVKGCKLYTKYFPCENCLKHLLQAGIKEIYYRSAFVESHKNKVSNSMNTSDSVLAAVKMLQAVGNVKTLNIDNGKSYIEEIYGNEKNVPKLG